jgi:hypothetical protein
MSRKTDYENLFPHPETVLRSMRAAAPAFMRCPKGHDLPSRYIWGRCSPVACLAEENTPGIRPTKVGHDNEASPYTYRPEMESKPRGLEAEVYAEGAGEEALEVVRARGQTEEALALMRVIGQKAARDALFPMPELPEAPSLAQLGPEEYVKQRLKHLAPLMLEAKIFEAVYGSSPEKRMLASEELLDRSGMAPRKNEGQPDYRGPVIILNGPTTVNPYEQQKTLKRIGNGKG